MKAKCFCSKHGKLGLEDIIIKDREPVCGKCYAPLDFTDVKPRKVK